MHKVSIITPFLNAERYLEETIQSVLAQTYTHWELLLADDGSTDESTVIARRYAELHPERVRYLEHHNHQHRGESATRNLALRHAAGEYIAFVDADDVWLPTKLEQQVGIIESQPEAGMVYGRALKWYSWSGKPEDAGRDCLMELGVSSETLHQPPALLLLLIKGRGVVPSPCTVMARREIVERVGGFEDEFENLYDDMVFYAKMFAEAPAFVSGECSAKYRQHENMSTSVAFEKGEWHPTQPNSTTRRYLTWLERYLAHKGLKSTEAWSILQAQLWPYRHPHLYYFKWRLDRLSRRIGWVASVGRRFAMGQTVGMISANPNPVRIKSGPALGVTTLTWRVNRAIDVEVRVGAPDGRLFSRSSGGGTQQTGKWVLHGQTFYLQDVSEGRPLSPQNTLATATVDVIDKSKARGKGMIEKLFRGVLAAFR